VVILVDSKAAIQTVSSNSQPKSKKDKWHTTGPQKSWGFQ
jgi:hypothetical protein